MSEMENESVLPEHVQAQRGHRRTHRGRRSRGKGPKPNHMAQANAHLKAAHDAPTKKETHAHLFRALSSLKKCS